MFKLPSPTAILAAIFIAVSIYGYGHHEGWMERDEDMQLAIAAKNEESRQKEEKLSEDLNTATTQLKDANDAISQKQSALDRAITAGRVHLRAPSCVQASASPTPAGGSGDQAGSQPAGPAESSTAADDSERQTLQIIAAIVAQGDRNTAQLNACIDAYEAVRKQVNSQGN